MNNMKAIVLAAGKGTRMQTSDNDAPKVMREVCGKPLLSYVLDALSFISSKDTIIVVGYMKELVIDYFSEYVFAEQIEQLGTGHAVLSAKKEISDFTGSVLVCCGDMPAVKRSTYETLAREHFISGNDCTILTGESSIQLPYGRIIRDTNNDFVCVVEERDCSPDQLAITELNSGVYVFKAQSLYEAIDSLKRDNSQSEYYLTDVPAIMIDNGRSVGICKMNLGDEIIGVNTLQQLVMVEGIFQKR